MDEEQYSALKSKIENVEGSTLTELPQELQPFYKQANNGKWRVAPWYNYTIVNGEVYSTRTRDQRQPLLKEHCASVKFVSINWDQEFKSHSFGIGKKDFVYDGVTEIDSEGDEEIDDEGNRQSTAVIADRPEIGVDDDHGEIGGVDDQDEHGFEEILQQPDDSIARLSAYDKDVRNLKERIAERIQELDVQDGVEWKKDDVKPRGEKFVAYYYCHMHQKQVDRMSQERIDEELAKSSSSRCEWLSTLHDPVLKTTIKFSCPATLVVSVNKKNISKGVFSIDFYEDHKHPTQEVMGYFNADLPAFKARELRNRPEYLSLPVHPALKEAAKRLLEAGWSASTISPRLLTAHLQRKSNPRAEIDQTVQTFLPNTSLSQSVTMGDHVMFPQKAGLTRDKITVEEVQRQTPAEDRKFSIDDYERACHHPDAIDEHYRFARKTDSTYSDVVLVGNGVGDMLFEEYRPQDLGSLAIDDTFSVLRVGGTRLFAFVVNHPRSNRAIPLAHLVLTGASTDQAKEELTAVLQWSLETLYSWLPRLHITRIMSDRCPAHINAYARTETARLMKEIDDFPSTEEIVLDNLKQLREQLEACVDSRDARPMEFFRHLEEFRQVNDNREELIKLVEKEVRLCRFHVLQAWDRKMRPKILTLLRKREGTQQQGAHFSSWEAVRRALVRIMDQDDLEHVQREFDNFCRKLNEDFPGAEQIREIIRYLKVYWMRKPWIYFWPSCTSLTRDRYNRTNNHLERYFGYIKDILVKKLYNIPQLLVFLNGDPRKRFSVLQSASMAGLNRTNEGATIRLAPRDKRLKNRAILYTKAQLNTRAAGIRTFPLLEHVENDVYSVPLTLPRNDASEDLSRVRVDVRRHVCSCRQVGRCEHLQFLTYVLRERQILLMKADASSKENPTSMETYLQHLEISVRDLVEEGAPPPANISPDSYAQDEDLGDIPNDGLAEEEESVTAPVTSETPVVGRKRCRAACIDDRSA